MVMVAKGLLNQGKKMIKKSILFVLLALILIPIADTIPKNIGDIKVNAFLFNPTKEKIKWIIYDTLFLIQLLSLFNALHVLCKVNYPRLSQVTLYLYRFAILRIVEYFLFFGKIPMWPIISGLFMWGLYKMYYGAEHTDT